MACAALALARMSSAALQAAASSTFSQAVLSSPVSVCALLHVFLRFRPAASGIFREASPGRLDRTFQLLLIVL